MTFAGDTIGSQATFGAGCLGRGKAGTGSMGRVGTIRGGEGGVPPLWGEGAPQVKEAEMNKIRPGLQHLTNVLPGGRADENDTIIEEEARRELMRAEADALRNALRPPLSENLQKLLPVLVDADDEFVPISTLTERAELYCERSVSTTLARLNRIAKGNSDMTWPSFLLGNDEIGYRLPDHLREVVRDVLEGV